MIQVKIQGLDKIIKGFKKSPEYTVNQLGKAVGRSMVTVHREAIAQAPVNKSGGGGNLRQKIRPVRINKLKGQVNSKAKYSEYVHEGTAPHIIRVRSRKVLANRRTGQIFGKRVRHPGTRANPFMERALKKSESRINRYFKTAIRNVIKMITR
jgi:HK97 gp10 family phage protein